MAPQHWSRRERQIMDILYRRGRGTAAEVQAELPDAPGYSAVRALLRLLEVKGQLGHERDGARFVFFARVPRATARRTALRQVVTTFFDGSASQAAAALLELERSKLTADDLDRLQALIAEARKEGR